MSTKGGQLQSKIMKYLMDKYDTRCVIYNIVKAGVNGVPDLLACIDGRFYGFEVKAEGDTEADLQMGQLARIGDAKGLGGFVYCIEDVQNIIDTSQRPVWDDATRVHDL